jgi:hypothetical protein
MVSRSRPQCGIRIARPMKSSDDDSESPKQHHETFESFADTYVHAKKPCHEVASSFTSDSSARKKENDSDFFSFLLLSSSSSTYAYYYSIGS